VPIKLKKLQYLLEELINHLRAYKIKKITVFIRRTDKSL